MTYTPPMALGNGLPPILAPLSPTAAFLSDVGWGVMPALGIALTIMGVMLSIRKRRMKTGSRPTAREQVERYRQQDGLKGDLETLMVEVEQLARDFSARLDAKAVHLEKLIREADEKIAQLRSAGPANRPPGPRSQDPEAAKPNGVANVEPAEDRLTTSIYALADDGLAAEEIARKLDEHVGKVELILALRNA